MSLKIGEKIKLLRKEQDVTQEKLATYLNISYQAISKWENGTAYPDISLLPAIANFFGVTSDELLGLKREEKTEELKEYETEYHELHRKGKVLEAIKIARKVLEKYPRNYQWMLNLAFGLVAYNATDEQREYSKAHGFIEEAIDLSEGVLEDCTVESIRQSAIVILCQNYPSVGKTERAIELANQMPEIFLCREIMLSRIYSGEQLIKQYQQNLLAMIALSTDTLYLLSVNSPEHTDENIEYIKAAVILLQTLLKGDENSLVYNSKSAVYYRRLAELYCQKNEAETAMEYLLLAEKCADSYDNCYYLGEHKLKSIFVNRCTINTKNVLKNLEGTQKEILLSMLSKNDFDILRDFSEFKELENRLKKASLA